MAYLFTAAAHSPQAVNVTPPSALVMLYHELAVTAACVVVHVAGNNMVLRFKSLKVDGADKLQGESIEHLEGLDIERLEFSDHGGWVFSPRA